MIFEYFYGSESEQFTFYRIPKILFKNEQFKQISCEAKVLYGLMLDRMSLSVKNKWFDEENRVYIIYTVDEIIEDIGCARQKATKLLDELANGIGLIEKKRQGLGKPNIIYVKNFVSEPTLNESSSMNIENQEVCKSNSQKYENHTSRNMILENQEVPKSYSNNTNNNYTEYNDNKFSDTDIISHHSMRKKDSLLPTSAKQEKDLIRWIEERNEYNQLIKDKIEYNIIVNRYPKAWLDEIIEIMVDVVCSNEPYIRINKQEYPQEVVKSRFLKINSSHIEYIYDSLHENTSNVRNIRAFLITTIYRSFETADNWYSAKVNYDLANPK